MINAPPTKGSIILVHGIRTHADWYLDVRDALETRGYRVHLTNYGRFDLFRFLLPTSFFRDRVKDKIFRQIRIAIQKDPAAKYSIIAHSFGTYVVSRILQDEFDLRIDRIIFVGSVVRYDFPFEQFSERFQGDLLNEVAAKDPWPALAESITTGYGSAGTFGFKNPGVYDRWNDGLHSAALTPEHAVDAWLPFLEEGVVLPGNGSTKVPFWIRLLNFLKIKYWFVLAILAVAFLKLGIFMYAADEFEVKKYATSLGWRLSTDDTAAKVNALIDQRCPLKWLDEHCDSWLARYITKRSWRGIQGYDHELNGLWFPDDFIFSSTDPELFWFTLQDRYPNCISISEIGNTLEITLDPLCDLRMAQ